MYQITMTDSKRVELPPYFLLKIKTFILFLKILSIKHKLKVITNTLFLLFFNELLHGELFKSHKFMNMIDI